MQNFNLFTWIREGVKQSVLLGVSDAVETLGVPDNSDELHPRLLQFLRQDAAEPAAAVAGAGASEARRKRLGRSLKDLETQDV